MDEMKISSKLMRGVVGKLIGRALSKKTGSSFDISLSELQATVGTDTAKVHFNGDIEMPVDDFHRLLVKGGLA